MRLRTPIIFLLLLIPSAYFVWNNSDMPNFGTLHDDGLYFVTGKSLATGQGFRILSLPEQPAQTKYPILYPLYLSLVWRINPHFPANLTLASWFSWALIALCLALTCFYWRTEPEWSEPRTWIVAGLIAISPVVTACDLLSEIFFLCWVLAALIAARREGVAMALFAGILAGCAYLSRTAGIALILSVPAWYLWRRASRRALAFAAGMLPFILGWTIWGGTHKFPATTPTLIYYTDYVKFQFLNVGLDNLALVLWKNLDELLYSMGALILPKVVVLAPVKILTQAIAIAMIAGIVRLVRRGIAVPYALFALVSSGMLIVWHFPPTERFVLPLFPLLAAGLVVELEHLVQLIRTAFRRKDAGQRVVAGVFAMAVLAIFGAALALQLFVTFKSMPEEVRLERAQWIETRATYAWIEQHLPASSAILSYNDPLLYLYTGHRGNSAPPMPRWWYAGDPTKVAGFVKDIVPYCRGRGLEYILATQYDMSRWSAGENAPALRRSLQENPQLESLYEAPSGATLFRIREFEAHSSISY